MPQAQQLGRYQLLDRIAFGGMAEIYRAKTFDSEGRERMVAVKRVLQHLTSDDDFIRMLVDEAKLTAILDHPAVARVYEFSQAGDEYFIAMEYVDGKDVRALLEKHRAMKTHIPVEHVAWIIAHVAEGLNAAHHQVDADGRPMHIVHRDVSPSNILCSYQGDAKLCDFGIAKATLTRVQTRTGVIKGKVKYMSPEQAMGRKLDGRSDLFSLGTVMYEMLTLEAPFMAATEVELIFTVRDAKKRDARELRPDLPAALIDILDRVMQRQRTDRFQNGYELSRELTGYLEKHHAGYRRAALGRYLRTIFKEDIEKDLRQLESWVLQEADASFVGVNLIADALPANAPYRSFSPASSLSVEVAAADAAPSDLHVAPTMITGKQSALPRRADLHVAETMMLEGRNADALHAQIRALNNFPGGFPEGLHEQSTKILDSPREKPVTPAKPAGKPPQKLPSHVKTHPPARTSHGSLPALPTRIAPPGALSRALTPPPVAAPRGARPANDTAPDSEPIRFDEDSNEPTTPRKKTKRPTQKSRPAHKSVPDKVIADFAAEDSKVGTVPHAELSDADVEE